MDSLHAPWRIEYILAPKPELKTGLFTRIAQSSDDLANFVIARDRTCFALLNRYPYNGGHLMVVYDACTWDLDKHFAHIESRLSDLVGVSYALYEQRVLDRASGRMVNANLEHYKLVGPREAPAIDVTVIENYQGRSATDAYGIAEPANIATAPAIGAAVYNAIGVRLRALPMTPAAVLEALGRIPRRG